MNDEDQRRVQAALDALGEHFDSVMIFVTLHTSTEDGTEAYAKGIGNWYARYGQVVEWVNREEAVSRNEVLGDGGAEA